MEIAIYAVVIALVVTVTVLQILWLLRVMRALESTARSVGGVNEQLDHIRNAIVVIGRHIRGEPDPAPARPRHSPKI